MRAGDRRGARAGLCDAIWNLDRLRDVRKLRTLLKEKP